MKIKMRDGYGLGKDGWDGGVNNPEKIEGCDLLIEGWDL